MSLLTPQRVIQGLPEDFIDISLEKINDNKPTNLNSYEWKRFRKLMNLTTYPEIGYSYTKQDIYSHIFGIKEITAVGMLSKMTKSLRYGEGDRSRSGSQRVFNEVIQRSIVACAISIYSNEEFCTHQLCYEPWEDVEPILDWVDVRLMNIMHNLCHKSLFSQAKSIGIYISEFDLDAQVYLSNKGYQAQELEENCIHFMRYIK